MKRSGMAGSQKDGDGAGRARGAVLTVLLAGMPSGAIEGLTVAAGTLPAVTSP